MSLFPDTRGVFIGLGEGRIAVNRAQNPVQADAVAHRQHELGKEFTGVATDQGDAENPVFARHGQDLDETVGFPIGNGAVQVIQRIDRDLAGDTLFARVLLVPLPDQQRSPRAARCNQP